MNAVPPKYEPKFKAGDTVRVIRPSSRDLVLNQVCVVSSFDPDLLRTMGGCVKIDGGNSDWGASRFELVVPVKPDYFALAKEHTSLVERLSEIRALFKADGFIVHNALGAIITFAPATNHPYTFRKTIVQPPIVEEY